MYREFTAAARREKLVGTLVRTVIAHTMYSTRARASCTAKNGVSLYLSILCSHL